MCELDGFEPDASEHMQGNKAIQLDFWAAFFATLPSASSQMERNLGQELNLPHLLGSFLQKKVEIKEMKKNVYKDGLRERG